MVLVAAWITSDSTRPNQARTDLRCGTQWLFRLSLADVARLSKLRSVTIGRTRLLLEVDISFRVVTDQTMTPTATPDWLLQALTPSSSI